MTAVATRIGFPDCVNFSKFFSCVSLYTGFSYISSVWSMTTVSAQMTSFGFECWSFCCCFNSCTMLWALPRHVSWTYWSGFLWYSVLSRSSSKEGFMTMTSLKPICSVRISNRLGEEDARMISYLLDSVLATAFMLGRCSWNSR